MASLIKITCINEHSVKPRIIYPLALGLHIYSAQQKLVCAGQRSFIETGIKLDIPQGYYAQVIGRYSMTNIGVYSGALTLDNSYKGPINILLDNKSRFDLPIDIGDPIAELMILPLDPPVVTYQNLLDDFSAFNQLPEMDLTMDPDQNLDI